MVAVDAAADNEDGTNVGMPEGEVVVVVVAGDGTIIVVMEPVVVVVVVVIVAADLAVDIMMGVVVRVEPFGLALVFFFGFFGVKVGCMTMVGPTEDGVVVMTAGEGAAAEEDAAIDAGVETRAPVPLLVMTTAVGAVGAVEAATEAAPLTPETGTPPLANTILTGPPGVCCTMVGTPPDAMEAMEAGIPDAAKMICCGCCGGCGC